MSIRKLARSRSTSKMLERSFRLKRADRVCQSCPVLGMKTQTQELKKHEKSKDIFCTVSDAFRVAARGASAVLGSAWAFAVAVLIILIWFATRPAFQYSDTWQLIINTGTTIVTFLMVFLIQNTQNRDAKATRLKLDEIIRAVGGCPERVGRR